MDIPTAVAVIVGARAVGPAVGNVAEDFAKRIFGPLADEAGTALAHPLAQMNKRRAERCAKMIESAAGHLHDKGIEAQQVPDYLLLPLLQHGSLIEDSDLEGVWAQLLASASAQLPESPVLPAFPGILSELSLQDVRLLAWMHEWLLKNRSKDGDRVPTVLFYKQNGIEYPSNQITEDNLVRLRLLELGDPVVPSAEFKNAFYEASNYPDAAVSNLETESGWVDPKATALGWAFMQACAGPKKQGPS